MNLMRQSWRDVSFLHWRYDPAIIRPLVPQGLELDLFDGAAWVGLVPFRIHGLTLPHGPAVPFLSSFPETNVRTYVRDRNGGSGVWFFSLDAARLLAVAGARAVYGLPYFWSAMRVSGNGRSVRYTSSRILPAVSSEVEVRIGDRIANPGPLDLFLTMRLRLYAKRLGRLWKADVTHKPWPLQRATVTLCRDSLLPAAGLPAPRGAALAHYARRVDVLVAPLSPL